MRCSLGKLIAPVLLVAALVPVGGVADEREQRAAELRELREQIDAVRAELAADRERRDDVSRELERTEREIGRLAGRIAELDRRLGANRARLLQLRERLSTTRERLAEHRSTLARQVRAAHRMGRQPALRLLLRQDAPDAVARTMAYYGYFNNARLTAMTRMEELVDEVERLRAEAQSTEQALAGDRDALAAEQEDLAAVRAERQEILARLDEDIDSTGERLERLEDDRDRLEDLLERLGSLIGDTPANPLESAPFDSQTGDLAWPIDGQVRTGYNSARAGGRLRWRGIVIGAEAGTAVRAVYHGRVVFADWLSGFGQLLIIDHQDGYMSLYGYNQRLLRAEGDWVTPGEEIAVVGDSGAQEQPGLYFEIRREGEPQDPLPWLATR